MTWTQYDCSCGETFGANGWTGGRTTASLMFGQHILDKHPEWVPDPQPLEVDYD